MSAFMPTPNKSRSSAPRTVFEEQREELVLDIARGMEHVLANINRLTRNLDSVIAVGNEFGSVEALWSQFENFMGRPQEEVERSHQAQGGRKDEHEQQHQEGDSEMQQ